MRPSLGTDTVGISAEHATLAPVRSKTSQPVLGFRLPVLGFSTMLGGKRVRQFFVNPVTSRGKGGGILRHSRSLDFAKRAYVWIRSPLLPSAAAQVPDNPWPDPPLPFCREATMLSSRLLLACVAVAACLPAASAKLYEKDSVVEKLNPLNFNTVSASSHRSIAPWPRRPTLPSWHDFAALIESGMA